MAPLKIGLTGGIAAGKSEALKAFARLGAATLSSDAVVHELLESSELRDALVARWGPEVAPDGTIDRAKIGEVVFADPEQLSWLEEQIHPLVRERTAAWLLGLPADAEVAVVEVPLLFEAGMEGVFDATIAVVAREELRRERAARRGHALEDERAARQLAQDAKAQRATFVVHNDGSELALERELSAILAKLKR